MEEWGSGYKRVIHACQSGGYPEPDWEELGTAFRVIFHPHPAVLEYPRADVPVNVPVNVPINVPINDRQRWLLEQLSAGKQIIASELAAYWSISDKTAKRDIADLKLMFMVHPTLTEENIRYVSPFQHARSKDFHGELLSPYASVSIRSNLSIPGENILNGSPVPIISSV